MLILKSKADLENRKHEIPRALLGAIRQDLEIIEDSYPQYAEEYANNYGPLVIVMEESEQEELEERFPVIKGMLREEAETIFGTKQNYTRTCYILTDSGFVIYYK